VARRRRSSPCGGWDAASEPLGDEGLDRLAEQLVAGVAEQGLGLSVDQHDPAAIADDHHRIGRGLEQAPEPGLGGAREPEAGQRRYVGVVDRHEAERAVGAVDRPHRDVDVDPAAVLAQPHGLEQGAARPHDLGERGLRLAALVAGHDQARRGSDRAPRSGRSRRCVRRPCSRTAPGRRGKARSVRPRTARQAPPRSIPPRPRIHARGPCVSIVAESRRPTMSLSKRSRFVRRQSHGGSTSAELHSGPHRGDSSFPEIDRVGRLDMQHESLPGSEAKTRGSQAIRW